MNEKEKVVMIPISSIDDFPNHPFEVRDDEEMELLANSISSNGVLNPVILRANGGRFEIIAGHRRKYACAKIGVAEVPAIVREMTREEAIVEMVDSNLHREHILPSEKAKAYKMKMDAMKSQGKRNDLCSAQDVICVRLPSLDGNSWRDLKRAYLTVEQSSVSEEH